MGARKQREVRKGSGLTHDLQSHGPGDLFPMTRPCLIKAIELSSSNEVKPIIRESNGFSKTQLGTEPLTLEPLRHTLRFKSYQLGKARTIHLWIPGAPPLHNPQTTGETEVPRYTAVPGRIDTQGGLTKGLRGKTE